MNEAPRIDPNLPVKDLLVRRPHLASALASRGFVTVIADYRLYPEVKYPDFLADSARAVRWACDHAARFGGDGRG